METNVNQKKLGKGGLIALVTVLGMAAPLSTDMYMPSLPKMAAYFNVPAILVNFTLVSFFLFMAVGMLILGICSVLTVASWIIILKSKKIKIKGV